MTANACPSCARLQAELDAARKERDEALTNGHDRIAELGAEFDQLAGAMADRDAELAALRTRLESLRDPTVAMVVAGVDAFMPTASHNADEVHGNDIATVWKAMYDAAIDTAATQGGAK